MTRRSLSTSCWSPAFTKESSRRRMGRSASDHVGNRQNGTRSGDETAAQGASLGIPPKSILQPLRGVRTPLGTVLKLSERGGLNDSFRFVKTERTDRCHALHYK